MDKECRLICGIHIPFQFRDTAECYRQVSIPAFSVKWFSHVNSISLSPFCKSEVHDSICTHPDKSVRVKIVLLSLAILEKLPEES